MMKARVPEHHHVPIGTETGQTDAVVDGDDVGTQHKGGLRDVVHIEAGLRRHEEDLGLLLGAHHSQVSLPGRLLGRRG